MARELPMDHFCPWREEAEDLRTQLTQMRAEIDTLKRHVYGRRSEKMPPMDREVRDGEPADAAAAQGKRRARAAIKKALPVEAVAHSVPREQRWCGACGKLMPRVGSKMSMEYDYVPGFFRRRAHVRETLACRCGATIVTAPAPARLGDGTQYGPGFVAHLVVSKCADSIPLHRLEAQYRREGVPVARSTMTDLFHRAADALAPVADRILERIAQAEVVQADETTMRLQSSKKRAYYWTFVAGNFVGYRFSTDRSGETPSGVLGGTRGTLVVDAYTGYNRVTDVAGRTRAGCLAHARRKFFDALSSAPEARAALDLIREIYRVEHDALSLGVVRTPAHLAMRQQRTRVLMDKLHAWLLEERPKHPPKSPLGGAIRYALEQWEPLNCFVGDVAIPPDNNRSENALRVVALGRKNFLFVAHEQAGRNLAVLYTVVHTCTAHGVNPLEYLRDVMVRVQTHPASHIDELLPDRWTPSAPSTDEPASATA